LWSLLPALERNFLEVIDMLRLTPFRKAVRRLFGDNGDNADPASSSEGRPNVARPRVPPKSSVTDRVAGLLAEQRLVAAGKLHLINLDGLKQRFGDRWESKATRIASVMEAALHRHLSTRDFFSQIDDGAYVIIFEQMTERDATVKCNLIAREVLQKLFGDADDVTGIVIQTAVANVDGSVDLKSSNPLSVIAGLLDDAEQNSVVIEGCGNNASYKADETTGSTLKAPAIAALPEGPADVDRLLGNEERRVHNWQVHLPPKGRIIYDPASDRARSPKGTAVDLIPAAAKPSPTPPKELSARFQNVKGIEFSYQPIWYAPKSAIVGYRCRLALRANNELISAEALVQEDGLRDASLMVDRLILRRALSDLAQLLASGGKAIIVVPLHAATFSTASAWRQFSAILAGLTSEMRMLIFLEIVDAVPLLGDRQLSTIVRRLSTRARRIIAHVPIYFRGFTQLRRVGFTGVCANIAGMAYGEADLISMIGQFSERAKGLEMRAVLTGVTSSSILTAGVDKGINYLAGPVIGEDAHAPSVVKALDLVDVTLVRH
jgi:EAL domain-containing protein (putative c-di-GMP-specific phosphodiesterase class I)